MILYVTYNDQPSGVYWSQVTDVVTYLNSMGEERVRLVAMVSIRDYFHSLRTIREHSAGAWVVPMVPRVQNWRINWLWIALIALITRPKGIIARGVFATSMALKLRDRELVERVCFDGRGAYGVEWKEYRIIEDEDLIAQSELVEAEVVQRSDLRLAVSEALVAHWRDRYGYSKQDHVVIPCTLRTDRAASTADRSDIRRSFGWNADDLVLVYSGGTGGWQSLDMLAKVVDGILFKDPSVKVLFLSGRDSYIDHLATRYPDRVAQRWIPHEQVHDVLSACDVGLLVRSRSVTNEVASPTKFAEYLNAGLPVLISRHIGDLGHFVERYKAGWIHDEHVVPMLEKPSVEQRGRLKRLSVDHFTKKVFEQEYQKILDGSKGVGGERIGSPSLVSIVVPSYNKKRYINEMIDSVKDQTYTNWELIIVDDASTDGTQDLIGAIAAEDPRIRTNFLPVNRGANHCRNKGIELAKGDHVIFLDADDLLGRDCLRHRLSVAGKEDLDLCVFTMEVFKRKKGDSTHRWIPSSSDPLADFFRHKLPWSVMQPIWRRSFLLRIGGFDESFKRHQDVEFHTRALLEPGIRYRTVIGEPDCFYRISEERKVLRPYELLEGFTESSLSYHSKFLAAATARGKRSMILGIIYQTYLQILLNFKNKVIGKAEFDVLEKQLFNGNLKGGMSLLQRMLFRMARSYNLMPVRIPGINRMIYRGITG